MSDSTAPPGSGQGPAGDGDGPRVTYELSWREGQKPVSGHSPLHNAVEMSQPGPSEPGPFEPAQGAGRRAAAWVLALPLFALPMLITYWRYSGSFEGPYATGHAIGRAAGFGFIVLFISALATAGLRRVGRTVALPLVLSVLSLAGVGLQYVLREHDKSELRAAVVDCLASGTQPFSLNSPRLAEWRLSPALQAEWTSLTQTWEPPKGSPVKADDYVMKPVMFHGNYPAVAIAVPGAGEERYRDEMLPAFGQLAGAGPPVQVDVAGREAYAGRFLAGAALITTNGCWGVLVIGRDIANVRAMTIELVRPATVPGRPVSGRAS